MILVVLLTAILTQAPAPPSENTASIQAGQNVFRMKCARCHDLNGQGYKGRDLTQLSPRERTTAQLSQTISQGVTGTEMPATKLDAAQLSQVIAYIQSLGGPAIVNQGDASRGEALFWGKFRCGNCHMVNGRGGRLGPELTQIGALRSKAILIREIRNPSEFIGRGFEPITVVTLSGERITGVRKNEDTFSLQMMDQQENIRLFLKTELREVIPLDQSLMPVYGPPELPDTELDDLLRFLAGLH